jgi:hypothetical protein
MFTLREFSGDKQFPSIANRAAWTGIPGIIQYRRISRPDPRFLPDSNKRHRDRRLSALVALASFQCSIQGNWAENGEGISRAGP